MPPRKRKREADGVENKTPRKAIRLTRSMTTEAARQAVFNTTELLERVILYVPPIKIFVIQRVCKQFHDLVQSSTPIQQRMFLKPSLKPRWWKIRRENGEDIGQYATDSMIEEQLKLLPCTEEESEAAKPSSRSLGKVMPALLNPLLRLKETDATARLPLPNRHIRSTNPPCEASYELTLGDLPLMDYGSWRDMLVTDPPPSAEPMIMLQYKQGPREDRSITYPDPDRKEFATLGTLIDAGLDQERRLWRVDGDHGFSSTYMITAVLEHVFSWVPRFNQETLTSIELPGIVIPTEAEWAELDKEGKLDEKEGEKSVAGT